MNTLQSSLQDYHLALRRGAVDPLTEVPASELLPHRSTRARPYLYSEEEVQRLLAAALQLPTDRSSSALRPWTFHCLLGLLSVTGLRISEALDLKLSDVDMQQAVLTIHAAKLGRSRLVPLHLTTCAVLAEYMRRREDFLGSRDSNYLFVSTKGRTASRSTQDADISGHRPAREIVKFGVPKQQLWQPDRQGYGNVSRPSP